MTQMLNVEVDQEGNTATTQPQVRNDLRGMEGKQLLNRLELDDDAVFDEKIDSVPRIELNPR